ncbi:MAG: HEAT repeat domain-containing protein [Aquificaceae bacterium]|nr:HEAT repeat domain-containing protein [Aquificaceae bacterium]MCX8164020.1 HEAT repeat domain-containing protein [Aquificaceae bacterium]
MQELLLADYSLKLKPLYGPFHRDMLNLSWLVEAISSSLRSGYFLFQSSDKFYFSPVLDGKPEGTFPDDFEYVSFFSTMENFVIHAFQLQKEHRIPLYSQRPVWVNLESINFNIREFFAKLMDFGVTGFVSVDNRIKLLKGNILLNKGAVVKTYYGGLVGLDGLKRLLEDLGEDVCTLKVYELHEEIVNFLLPGYEFAGLYKSFEQLPLHEMKDMTMVISVSPEKYGYLIYKSGKEVLMEGFEKDAPFYEVLMSCHTSVTPEPMEPLSLLGGERHLRIVKYDPEHPVLYFCPACWSVISKDDRVCPNCGYDLGEFHNLPYEYKLIMALEHPMKEMKRNVIYTIGRKDLEIAIPHLEVMIAKETDPLLLIELADALSRMSSPEAVRLLRAMAQHRYPVVRSRAHLHLQRRLKHVHE